MKKLFLFSFMSLILTLSFASTASAEDGFILKYKVNLGKSTIYKMRMDGVTTMYVDNQTQITKVENEMFLNQKATDFDKETRVISFHTQVASGQMKINGVPSPMPMMGQTIATQMKETGELINPQNAQTGQLNAAQLIFPKTAVKIGDKWSHVMPPNTQMPVPVIIGFKIMGKEIYRGRDCYKIGMTMKTDNSKPVKGMDMNLSAKGVIRFDHKDGILVSNHVNSNLKMTIQRVIGGRNTTITTRMEMKVRMDLQV